MKTAQKLCYKNQIFYLRNYVLDLTTLRMYIFKVGKAKPDLTISFLKEENRVIEVDANLTNRLVVNYKNFFKTQLKDDIQMPGEFQFPLVVRLEGNQMMLLWLASEVERSIWAQAFRDIMVQKLKEIEPPK